MGSAPRLRSVAGLVAAALALAALPSAPARPGSLEDILQLELLINAAGVETLVAGRCPANHAGYYERDGQGGERLVICRTSVNLADADAVWQVMAHEATHIMQICGGGPVIPEEQMPRTHRELRRIAPHAARLIREAYGRGEQRLEAEAFWMELQPPRVVLERFRSSCATRLRRSHERR